MAAARWALGTSALVITVPAAEPVVGPWRLQYDPSAAAGMPAHVTVLYPWLAASAIDDHVLDRLVARPTALRRGVRGRGAASHRRRPPGSRRPRRRRGGARALRRRRHPDR